MKTKRAKHTRRTKHTSRAPRLAVIVGIGVIVLCLVGLWVIEYYEYIIINWSASIPRGIYTRMYDNEITYGDYVTFEFPKEQFFEPNQAPWYPEGGEFIKPVVGLPGDTIIRYRNGYQVAHTVLQPRYMQDRHGAKLPSLLEPYAEVPPEALLVGSVHAGSFDSRYFGPVVVSQITGVYQLLWEW